MESDPFFLFTEGFIYLFLLFTINQEPPRVFPVEVIIFEEKEYSKTMFMLSHELQLYNPMKECILRPLFKN
ncbi:MAG TPA: hypothetical protein DEP01_01310 [Aminobacterium sp.]|nr:hypothetical protein [Aminobacterium sp.]